MLVVKRDLDPRALLLFLRVVDPHEQWIGSGVGSVYRGARINLAVWISYLETAYLRQLVYMPLSLVQAFLFSPSQLHRGDEAALEVAWWAIAQSSRICLVWQGVVDGVGESLRCERVGCQLDVTCLLFLVHPILFGTGPF